VVKLNALPGIIGKAVGLAGDMSKESEIKILLRKIRDGGDDHIDILIANAGATWGGPFEESPDWATAKVLDLNVRGVFNLVKEALPMLEKRASHSDPSRVIIVSSIANSKVVHTGQNSTIIYSVSKAAATHMARNFAVELGPRNITCNSISPGFFPSKLANGLIENLGGLKHLESMNPRRRLGEPDDIAGAMLYLCSRAGNYINGVDLEVDGGDRLGRGSLRKKDKKNSKL
jgi:NAD(P)-dependent dehydrogenase (short-subunit alcohol dehydrogenase family)